MGQILGRRAVDEGALVIMYVLIAIHLTTRKVSVVGMSPNPCDASPEFARTLTATNGFLRAAGATTIILDRDSNYSAEFKSILTEAGYELNPIPPRQPWMNGYAERMVRTLKNGLFRKIVVMDVVGLEAVCSEFLDHYHNERPHQGLGNQLINPPANPPLPIGKVIRHDRLGGSIHHYARAAA